MNGRYLVIHIKSLEWQDHSDGRATLTRFTLAHDITDDVLADSHAGPCVLCLDAVVVFMGEDNQGHYVCYVKQTDGSWMYISDSLSSAKTRDEVNAECFRKGSLPYMLVYVKRPSPPSSHPPLSLQVGHRYTAKRGDDVRVVFTCVGYDETNGYEVAVERLPQRFTI